MEKLQKYLLYNKTKLMDINSSQVKKMLPPDQSGIIQQAKRTYLSLGKGYENQRKAIEDQEKTIEKQLQGKQKNQ